MFFRALAAIAISALVYAQQSPRPAGYTISGIVVNHATNQPLGGVGVMLNSTQQAGETRRPRVALTVVTSPDGKFSFTDLPPGKYALVAQQRNQQTQTYQGYEGFFTGVVAGPDIDSSHIVFPLQSPARLAGTVIDDSGEPVQGSVLLFRKDIANGKLEITQAAQTNTTASGAFHFAHLAPGTYFIAVNGRPWYAEAVPAGQSVPAEFDVAYPVTYYGETSDPNAAAPIQLSEGGSATIQISLHAVPAVHVPVSEGGENEAVGGRGFSAAVYAEGPGGARIPVNAWTTGGNSGFELAGMAPGRYFVDVNVQDMVEMHAIAERRFRGEMDLVQGASLTPTRSSPISISGRVSNESGEVPEGAMVMLVGKENYYGEVNKDGSIAFNQENAIAPGSYQVQIGNAPHVYVKSVAAGAASVQAGTIQIADGAKVELSIAVAQAIAKIRGFAVRQDKPVSAAMVLLLPADPKQSPLVRRDQSDSDGSFLLADIVPGRYYLLAIDDGHDLAYLDPEVIKPYLSGAITLDVTNATDASLKVNVIARRTER